MTKTLNSGRIQDVLIENMTREQGHGLVVWADPDNRVAIESVEGVSSVSVTKDDPTRYWVYLDKRYDSNIVRQNILKTLGYQEELPF